jgi:hypothetical protein
LPPQVFSLKKQIAFCAFSLFLQTTPPSSLPSSTPPLEARFLLAFVRVLPVSSSGLIPRIRRIAAKINTGAFFCAELFAFLQFPCSWLCHPVLGWHLRVATAPCSCVLIYTFVFFYPSGGEKLLHEQFEKTARGLTQCPVHRIVHFRHPQRGVVARPATYFFPIHEDIIHRPDGLDIKVSKISFATKKAFLSAIGVPVPSCAVLLEDTAEHFALHLS